MLEAIPGLFGIRGMGWIYAGCTRRGFWLLGGVLLWNLGEAVLIAATSGAACCITMPLNLIMVGTSMGFLINHIHQNPQEASSQLRN